ncbi:MAG: hypothetical protein ABIE43_00705 [Patescibacteria group bacterium]
MAQSQVVLKAEAVSDDTVKGKKHICPTCNENETRGNICRPCYRKFGGNKASATVAEVAAGYQRAKEGHEAALKSDPDVPRDIVFPGVLTQIELSEDAQINVPNAAGINPFLTVKIPTPEEGFMDMYVFGVPEEMRGRTICVVVEGKTKLLKNKLKKGGERQICYYLRAQHVPELTSSVALAINGGSDFRFPSETWNWTVGKRELHCTVGFVPVD